MIALHAPTRAEPIDTELADAPWMRAVGPGWETVLLPAAAARPAARTLETLAADPLGAIFATGVHWGFFVPEESDNPPWPPGSRYYSTGTTLTLPPSSAPSARSRWIRFRPDGRLVTAPLLLHAVVTAVHRSAGRDRLC